MPELTDTQVVVLDTLRTVVVTYCLREKQLPMTLEAGVRTALEGQGISWGDFVEFCGK
jgi:hypothetical protein